MQEDRQKLKKSIVVVDLAHFTKKINLLERLDEPPTRLAYEIERFFLQAFGRMNLLEVQSSVPGFVEGRPLLKYTGDGAILHFDTPQQAVQCAELIQTISKEFNATQTEPEAKRVFRVGVATGKVEVAKLVLSGTDLAGSLIGTAARLEAACDYGHVLIDEATFMALPDGSDYAGPVAKKIGKESDGVSYTAYDKRVNENAKADVGQQSAWWIYRDSDAVVRGVIGRLRDQMPPFNPQWGLLSALAGAQKFATATEFIDWAAQATPLDELFDQLVDYQGPKDLDEQHWAEELLLLFACRAFDFTAIKPLQQVSKTSDPKNAALVGWVPCTSALVAATCLAGLTGKRIHFSQQADAFEIRQETLAKGTVDFKRAALEELFRKVVRKDVSVGAHDDELIGKVSLELERQRKKGKAAVVCLSLDNKGTQAERDAILRGFAELINHLVIGTSENNHKLLNDAYGDMKSSGALARLATRLEYSLQSVFIKGPR